MAGEKQRAAQRSRFREVAAEAMDIGAPAPQFRDTIAGAEDLALARAGAAVAAGRPLRANERRQIRQQVLGEQAGQQAAEGQRGRPSVAEWRKGVRSWLLGLGPVERAEVEETARFRGFSARAQAEVLGIRERVNEELADVSYSLGYNFDATVSDDYGGDAWSESELAGELAGQLEGWEEADDSDAELEAKLEGIVGDKLEAEGDAVYAAWEGDDEEGEGE
jgi:hypothetical protein